MSYSDELKVAKWQRLKAKVCDRDNWTCTVCGNAERELHVHHRYYIKGKNVWDYPASALQTLCDRCHKDEHHYDSRAVIKSVRHIRFEAGIEKLAGLFLKYTSNEEFKKRVDARYNKSMNKPNYDQAA